MWQHEILSSALMTLVELLDPSKIQQDKYKVKLFIPASWSAPIPVLICVDHLLQKAPLDKHIGETYLLCQTSELRALRSDPKVGLVSWINPSKLLFKFSRKVSFHNILTLDCMILWVSLWLSTWMHLVLNKLHMDFPSLLEKGKFLVNSSLPSSCSMTQNWAWTEFKPCPIWTPDEWFYTCQEGDCH